VLIGIAVSLGVVVVTSVVLIGVALLGAWVISWWQK